MKVYGLTKVKLSNGQIRYVDFSTVVGAVYTPAVADTSKASLELRYEGESKEIFDGENADEVRSYLDWHSKKVEQSQKAFLRVSQDNFVSVSSVVRVESTRKIVGEPLGALLYISDGSELKVDDERAASDILIYVTENSVKDGHS